MHLEFGLSRWRTVKLEHQRLAISTGIQHHVDQVHTVTAWDPGRMQLLAGTVREPRTCISEDAEWRIDINVIGIVQPALMAAEGKGARSLELLTLVLHHPASWQMTRDKAAARIAALEAELPPDVAAAARERGRARHLESTLAELLDELEG